MTINTKWLTLITIITTLVALLINVTVATLNGVTGEKYIILSDLHNLKLHNAQTDQIIVLDTKNHSIGFNQTFCRSVDYFYDKNDNSHPWIIWLTTNSHQPLFMGQLDITGQHVKKIEQLTINQSLSGAARITVNRFTAKPNIYVVYKTLDIIQQFTLDVEHNQLLFVRNITAEQPTSVVVDPDGSRIVWIEKNKCILSMSINGNTEKRDEIYCINRTDQSIKAIALSNNWCYYALSNGDIKRLQLNYDGKNTESLIDLSNYPSGSRFSRNEHEPTVLEVADNSDGRLDIFVSDKKHHVITHFKLFKRNSSKNFSKSSSSIAEHFISDFRLLTLMQAKDRQNVLSPIGVIPMDKRRLNSALNLPPSQLEGSSSDLYTISNESTTTSMSTTHQPLSTTTNSIRNFKLSSTTNHVTSTPFSPSPTEQLIDNNEVNVTFSMNNSTTLLSQQEDEDRDSNTLLWFIVGGAAGLLLVLVLLLVSCRISRSIFYSDRIRLIEPLPNEIVIKSHIDSYKEYQNQTNLVNQPHPNQKSKRKIRTYSGGSKRPPTAIRSDGTIAIEDLGGFGNPQFDHHHSSGGHKKNRACDVCDYKIECEKEGVCLSTFRLLD